MERADSCRRRDDTAAANQGRNEEQKTSRDESSTTTNDRNIIGKMSTKQVRAFRRPKITPHDDCTRTNVSPYELDVHHKPTTEEFIDLLKSPIE